MASEPKQARVDFIPEPRSLSLEDLTPVVAEQEQQQMTENAPQSGQLQLAAAKCECSLQFGFHRFSAKKEAPEEDPLFDTFKVQFYHIFRGFYNLFETSYISFNDDLLGSVLFDPQVVHC
jgi:hypothetical protein